MAKPKPCRSYEFTGDILDHDGEYKKFFRGLTEYLKSKLQRVEVKGGRHNYNQYTCGQLHDRRKRRATQRVAEVLPKEQEAGVMVLEVEVTVGEIPGAVDEVVAEKLFYGDRRARILPRNRAMNPRRRRRYTALIHTQCWTWTMMQSWKRL